MYTYGMFTHTHVIYDIRFICYTVYIYIHVINVCVHWMIRVNEN